MCVNVTVPHLYVITGGFVDLISALSGFLYEANFVSRIIETSAVLYFIIYLSLKHPYDILKA